MATNWGSGGNTVLASEGADDGTLNLKDLLVVKRGECREDCGRLMGLSVAAGEDWRGLDGVRAVSGVTDFGRRCSGLRRMKVSAVTAGGGEMGCSSRLEERSWQIDKSLSAGKGPFSLAEGM